LREKHTIAKTRKFLQRIHCLCALRHRNDANRDRTDKVNVRVFLAAYMIAFRPTHVFESMGTLEQRLFESSIPMLTAFHRIVEDVISTKSFQGATPDITATFQGLLYEYLKNFKTWKVPDEAKLTARITHALRALYDSEAHLPQDEGESRLALEFRTQIARLRSKLSQIAGANALAQFDGERTAGVAASGDIAYNALPGRLTNEQMAHELLLDPTFQLDDAGMCFADNSVHHRIRETFHKAFWASLDDDLKLTPPCFVRVLRVLAEIRDGIHDTTGCACISEIIDVPFIQSQLDLGVFDATSCRALAAAIFRAIREVQSPQRDTETRAMWAALDHDMCKTLEFLLKCVNFLRIDAANTR
jgi:hypothetical protein